MSKEDITENVKHIAGIPFRLNDVEFLPAPVELEVRREVYLPVEQFERINAEREAAGKKLFVNPRNAAAGILQTKDIEAVNLDDGRTLEILRCCTDGTRNACSKLYGACCRVGFDMG